MNFVRQLAWCPDIWLNITLGVSMKYFRMRLTFELVDWLKSSSLWVRFIPPTEGLNRTKRQSKSTFALCLTGLQLGLGLLLPLDLDLHWDVDIQVCASSQTLMLRVAPHHQPSGAYSFPAADPVTLQSL